MTKSYMDGHKPNQVTRRTQIMPRGLWSRNHALHVTSRSILCPFQSQRLCVCIYLFLSFKKSNQTQKKKTNQNKAMAGISIYRNRKPFYYNTLLVKIRPRGHPHWFFPTLTQGTILQPKYWITKRHDAGWGNKSKRTL